MKLKYITIGAFGLVLMAGATWYAYLKNAEANSIKSGEKILVKQDTSTTSALDEQSVDEPVRYELEIVAQNLEVPWSILFASDNRILVAERAGRVREIVNGELQQEPIHVFDEVSTRSEEGLMGMTLDPDYNTNKFVYACYAYERDGELLDKVVRMKDTGDALEFDKVILDRIPAARYHAGCRIAFGPDNALYITTGDATDKNIAQDLDSLGGKILRINSDGSIPSDNPFENSPVYSFGHRNPQGIDWTSNGVLLSTEHGPSTFDGPPGGDEVNKIEPGKNYGWPRVSHDRNEPGLIAPLVQFTPAVAPASAMVYTGNAFPAWKDMLFFGGLKGEGVFVVSFDQQNQVTAYEKLDINLGRIREITQGPDGYIYFSTSNRDGRGEIRSGDDKIYRMVPVARSVGL